MWVGYFIGWFLGTVTGITIYAGIMFLWERRKEKRRRNAQAALDKMTEKSEVRTFTTNPFNISGNKEINGALASLMGAIGAALLTSLIKGKHK